MKPTPHPPHKCGFFAHGGCGGIDVKLKLIMNRIDAESAKREEGVAHGKTPFQPRCVKDLHL
jgi:hypothetical protein